MNSVLRETFSIRQIAASLLISATWLAVVVAEQYPVEDWAGAVVTGYLVWRASNEAVFRLAQFGIRKVLAYTRSVYDRQAMDLPSDSKATWQIHLVVFAYLYSLGFIISGMVIVISPKVIEAVGLPTLELNEAIGLAMIGIGGLVVVAFFGNALIRLILLGRSMRAARHITSQAIVVSDYKLTRSRFPVVASS